jgi:hypothetical protein
LAFLLAWVAVLALLAASATDPESIRNPHMPWSAEEKAAAASWIWLAG